MLGLHNQAAAADFIEHLPSHDLMPQNLIEAQANSFVNPATGKLDIPGLGNSPSIVKVDQKRHVYELLP